MVPGNLFIDFLMDILFLLNFNSAIFPLPILVGILILWITIYAVRHARHALCAMLTLPDNRGLQPKLLFAALFAADSRN
jgi:hypothetical protein